MLCYRDMTFCAYHVGCKSAPECPRAYTKEVQRAAEEWWGGPDAPVALFVDRPECFVYNGQADNS